MQPIIRITGKIVGLIEAELHQLYSRYLGRFHRFDGDALAICEAIILQLWHGDFFRTSLGHFNFYFVRDFGTVSASLVATGYKKHVLHTMRWALLHYRRAGTVTTCIDRRGNCFNAPSHAIDSLPWLLHSLVACNYDLNQPERAFLNKELQKYRKKYLDTTGHVRPMRFAEMRDAVIYDRSAYAVALVARMATCAGQLGLEGFAFAPQKYQKELITRYWNGRYFNADRQNDAFSAECALLPFFLGVIDDTQMLAATLNYINDEGFNKPFPLLYTKHSASFKYRFFMTKPFMAEYEGDTLWSWHGIFYLHLLQRLKRPEYQVQKEAFAQGMIESHGTFPELLNKDGSWYKAPIIRGGQGMVWAALYVDLVTREQAYDQSHLQSLDQQSLQKDLQP